MIAGRNYAQVYDVSGSRSDTYDFIVDAIAASGGRVLYWSSYSSAPFFLGVESEAGERLGLLIYPFTVTSRIIKNRPVDEVRGQIRYGRESTWIPREDHPVGFDITGVDVTLLLGVHLDGGVFIGMDPKLYDPLPMGISFYSKTRHSTEAAREGWCAWERRNSAGAARPDPRSETRREALVAFAPHRLLDYAKFERYATDLRLDQPLRLAAALTAKQHFIGSSTKKSELHALEEKFQLSGNEILEIIAARTRLEVAVKGGVAEFHLQAQLLSDPHITAVEGLDEDGQPDFRVGLTTGETILLECKNASPNQYANGDFRVEVQKTRSSGEDKMGRLYSADQFQIVAACLFSATGEWVFRFRHTRDLARHKDAPERLRPMQRVTDAWSTSVIDAL